MDAVLDRFILSYGLDILPILLGRPALASNPSILYRPRLVIKETPVYSEPAELLKALARAGEEAKEVLLQMNVRREPRMSDSQIISKDPNDVCDQQQ